VSEEHLRSLSKRLEIESLPIPGQNIASLGIGWLGDLVSFALDKQKQKEEEEYQEMPDEGIPLF